MPFNDLLTQRLVNCLPYPLNLLDDEGKVVRRFPASDNPVRVIEERDEKSTVDFFNVGHVPVIKIKSRLSRYPDPMDGISYIVSLRVLQLMAIEGLDTSDLYAPYDLLWEDGKIKGFKRLLRTVVGP